MEKKKHLLIKDFQYNLYLKNILKIIDLELLVIFFKQKKSWL